MRNQEKVLREQEDDHTKLRESLLREHELQVKEDAALVRSLKRQHVNHFASGRSHSILMIFC